MGRFFNLIGKTFSIVTLPLLLAVGIQSCSFNQSGNEKQPGNEKQLWNGIYYQMPENELKKMFGENLIVRESELEGECKPLGCKVFFLEEYPMLDSTFTVILFLYDDKVEKVVLLKNIKGRTIDASSSFEHSLHVDKVLKGDIAEELELDEKVLTLLRKKYGVPTKDSSEKNGNIEEKIVPDIVQGLHKYHRKVSWEFSDLLITYEYGLLSIGRIRLGDVKVLIEQLDITYETPESIKNRAIRERGKDHLEAIQEGGDKL